MNNVCGFIYRQKYGKLRKGDQCTNVAINSCGYCGLHQRHASEKRGRETAWEKCENGNRVKRRRRLNRQVGEAEHKCGQEHKETTTRTPYHTLSKTSPYGADPQKGIFRADEEQNMVSNCNAVGMFFKTLARRNSLQKCEDMEKRKCFFNRN